MGMNKKEIIKEHYRKLGKKGRQTVVDKYGVDQFKIWGKQGGRPRKQLIKEPTL
jgi:hypothetical protein